MKTSVHDMHSITGVPTSGKVVVLAEKPSVAKAVADWYASERSLPKVNKTGCVAVGNVTFTWLFGHLLENFMPDEYTGKPWAKWSMATLPIIPDPWLLRVKNKAKSKDEDPGSRAQVEIIRSLLASADFVVGAGDPDGEGQLLQDELLIWLGCKVPVSRLWLASVDTPSIRKAWAAVRPNAHYEGDYWSALSRSHGDYLFGINGTRAATLASQANGGNVTLTLGRVQTPTLGLAYLREMDIKKFKPVNYFTPCLQLGTKPPFKADWAPDKDTDTRLDPEGRLLDKRIADALQLALEAGSATVTSVSSKKGTESPPSPFSLSGLQSHMGKLCKMSVMDTLEHAQFLYVKGLASYPRVDTEYLPEDQFPDAPALLQALGAFKDLTVAADGASCATRPPIYDSKKAPVHHAIVPLPCTPAQIAALDPKKKAVWFEIAKRFILQFYPAAVFTKTELRLECEKEAFKASGKTYLDKGWKNAFTAVAEDEEEGKGDKKVVVLPKVEKGDVLPISAVTLTSTITKPPKRYTDFTLLDDMKAVHKFVSDPSLKSVLRENIGIGTEATRANTIAELLDRGFLVSAGPGGLLKPSDIAIQYMDVLPRQLWAPDMTAVWQQAMDDIKKTKKPGYDSFVAGQSKWLEGLVVDIPKWFAGKAMFDKSKKAPAGSLETKPTKHTCLTCKGPLAHIKGKFGWFFGCQDPACKAIFKDIAGAPVAKVPQPADVLEIDGVKTGDKCPACGTGIMKTRVCGPGSKAPGKLFLSCTNFAQKGAKQCTKSLWPK